MAIPPPPSTSPPPPPKTTSPPKGGGSLKPGGKPKPKREPGMPTTPGKYPAGKVEKAQAKEAAARRREQARRTKAALAFQTQLVDWGIGITPGLKKLTKKAANQGYSLGTFVNLVRQSKTYKERFSGIEKVPGMSEEEYLTAEAGYMQIAGDFDMALAKPQLEFLISTQVTAESLGRRLEAMERVRENPFAFRSFGQVLKARGLHSTGNLSLQEMADFSLGSAPGQWREIYEEVSYATAVQAAGLEGVVDREDVLELMARSPNTVTEEELAERFSGLAERIRTAIPLSKLSGFNITERDLVEMELYPNEGKAAQTAATIERILADVESRRTSVAATPIVAEQVGRQRAGRPQSL